ncbi:hypothetical protein XELAEV_18011147mg, partial [Xenopus laevis]
MSLLVQSDVIISDAVISDDIISDVIISDAVIREAIISDAVNREAIISDAVISDDIISDVIISDARGLISDVIISDAVISDAIISDAVIRKAIISDAIISDVIISDVLISDVIISDAVIRKAIISDAIISDVIISDVWVGQIPAGPKGLPAVRFTTCGIWAGSGWALLLALPTGDLTIKALTSGFKGTCMPLPFVRLSVGGSISGGGSRVWEGAGQVFLDSHMTSHYHYRVLGCEKSSLLAARAREGASWLVKSGSGQDSNPMYYISFRLCLPSICSSSESDMTIGHDSRNQTQRHNLIGLTSSPHWARPTETLKR